MKYRSMITIGIFLALLSYPLWNPAPKEMMDVSPISRRPPQPNRRANELFLHIRINDTIIHSGHTALINITVTNDGGAVENISINLTTSSGSFQPENTSTDSLGMASVEYTASFLNYTRDVEIVIIANRSEGDENRTSMNITVLSIIDHTPPSVKSSSPSSNSTNVSTDTNITLEFSETMNRTSVESALLLAPNIDHTLLWNGNNITMIFTTPLNESTSYEVTLTTIAKDLYGNSLNTPFILSFTTWDSKLPALEALISYLPSMFSGESQIIRILVQNSSLPIGNATVLMNASKGTIALSSGYTVAQGYLNITYAAPNESALINDQITVTVMKTGFRRYDANFSIRIDPLTEGKLDKQLALDEGSIVHVTGSGTGSIDISLEEVENPSRFITGFMDIFFKIAQMGQGTLVYTNITLENLVPPEGYDESSISLHYFQEPNGPWLKCHHTGILIASNTIWANITWEGSYSSITLAPRAKDFSESLRGNLKGNISADNRTLPDIRVDLYKSEVRIYSSYTDQNGTYSFKGIETGIYEVSAGDNEYLQNTDGAVLVIAGVDTVKDIILTQKVNEEDEQVKDDAFPVVYLFFLFFFIIIIVFVSLKLYIVRMGHEDDEPPTAGYEKRNRGRGFDHFERNIDYEGEFECPVCGSSVSEDSDFCNICLAEFVTDAYVCPDCGMPLSPEDKYCEFCGTVFGDANTDGGIPDYEGDDEYGIVRAIEDFEVEEEDEMLDVDIEGEWTTENTVEDENA